MSNELDAFSVNVPFTVIAAAAVLLPLVLPRILVTSAFRKKAFLQKRSIGEILSFSWEFLRLQVM